MRYLCLLIGESDIEGPVPGTPEFAQMLSDFESATQADAAGRGCGRESYFSHPSTAGTGLTAWVPLPCRWSCLNAASMQ